MRNRHTSNVIQKYLLSAVWLATIIFALIHVVTHFDKWGIWGIVAILLGILMFSIFIMDTLGRSSSWFNPARRLSEYLLPVVIGFLILALATSLVYSLLNLNMVLAGVLAVFLVVLVGILRDNIRHLR